jgi:hypothetical protein
MAPCSVLYLQVQTHGNICCAVCCRYGAGCGVVWCGVVVSRVTDRLWVSSSELTGHVPQFDRIQFVCFLGNFRKVTPKEDRQCACNVTLRNVIIKYYSSECVSVALDMQHAKRMRRIAVY